MSLIPSTLTSCWHAQARADTNAAASTSDDWELDPSEIAFHDKIASGAFGDLYRGTYCGQDVAIKILRNVQTNSQQFAEFQQVLFASLWPHLYSSHVSRAWQYTVSFGPSLSSAKLHRADTWHVMGRR